MTAVAQNLLSSMSPTTQAPPETTTSVQQVSSTEYSGSTGSSASMTDTVMSLLNTLSHMGILGQGSGSVKDSSK